MTDKHPSFSFSFLGFLLLFIIFLFIAFLSLTNKAEAVICNCKCYPECIGILYDNVWGYYRCCNWSECPLYCGDPDCTWEGCKNCSSCGGCFIGETRIEAGSEESEGQNEEEIKDLKEGDVVSSFNPETGEIKEGTVSDITKLTRKGYFELETESGKKVKVTAEHPFLAVSENDPSSAEASEGQGQLSNSKFQIIDKFKNILSNTLTYKLITGLQVKMSEVLK